MSGFTDYQASGASEASGSAGAVLTWTTAQSMLPLVRGIVGDIVQLHGVLAQLHPEKTRLDRERLSLDWPSRRRRYQVTEEIARTEARLQEARAELEGLGVALVDEELGQVGFPTIVNNRRAFFSWRPSDEAVEFWHFVDNHHRRPVPAAWKEPTESPRREPKKSRRN